MSLIKIFISHSSHDEKLATAVYDLLVASLGLTAADLRATSVTGAKLPAGTDHAPTIRKEVREATVCVGLITPNSMASEWAIFEMGARWGLASADQPFLPMRARGVDLSVLPSPLTHLQSNSLGDRSEVHQMISQIAERLGISAKPAHEYSRQLEAVVKAKPGPPKKSNASGTKGQDSPPESAPVHRPVTTATVATRRPATSEESDLALARAHCKAQYPTDFAMQSFCLDQQRQAVATLRQGPPAGFAPEVYATIEAEGTCRLPRNLAHSKLEWMGVR